MSNVSQLPHIETAPVPGGRLRKRLTWAFVALAFVFCVLYLGWYTRVGWLPEDDGVLGQSAARVMAGQLPHADYTETYTGGLTFLNALSFRVFGVNLLSMRWMMMLFFIAWLPAVFYVAARLFSPAVSAAIMIMAVVIGIPNYPTPMPSWYNMMFATMGIAMLLRYMEHEGRKWLFFAGVFAGLSILIKIIGLYFVAAVFLFLLFREQSIHSEEDAKSNSGGTIYRLLSIAGVSLFVAAVVRLTRSQVGVSEFCHYVLPSLVTALVVVWHEFRVGAGTARRFRTLWRMLAPFLLGIIAPISIFLIPYIKAGSVHALLRGVFLEGLARAQGIGALVRPQEFFVFLVAIPTVILITVATFWKRDAGPMFVVPVFATGLALLVSSWRSETVSEFVWVSVSVTTPLFVLLGVILILAKGAGQLEVSSQRTQQFFLLLAVAAVCSLVQFPFPVKIYFCYFAPLLVLAVSGMVSLRRPSNPIVLFCVMAFYIAFFIVRVAPDSVYDNRGFIYPRIRSEFTLPRAAGLRVEGAHYFEQAVRVALEHSNGGPLIATPECPEIYFLSGLRNPVHGDGALQPDELLSVIDNTPDLSVVVLNGASVFSRSTITPELLTELDERFPSRADVGKYRVYWREQGSKVAAQ